MSLETLGWGPDLDVSLSSLISQSSSNTLVPGRVVRQQRGLLTVQTAGAAFLARASGRLLHQAQGVEALPTVGDWVLLQPPASGDGEALMHAVLPRRSLLKRREAGSEHDAQLIAANVDVVFLVTGLDGNFNPRRIERSLTVAWNSGATPVVLLSKADLADDAAERVLAVESLAPGVDVLAVSARTGLGVEDVRARLPPGRTGVLLGSSGVGKSTLANRLLDAARLVTQPVGPEDKGQHTTTHRELFVLEHGGLVIDGPGMRELGLWGDEEEGLATAFADVLALATGCRFSDCGHQGEPGCAVRAAVEDGTLSEERRASFQKLQREQAFQLRQTDAAAQRAHKRVERARSNQGWTLTRSKRRGE
ncbi:MULTISPECIES: ribosome small subunit-dependent GTPase A [unclassified Corallococcus]|uniref:ribosome small subunit-dependent GTPase A n=1 Tax=unclassified Corallococcus TaxID=2685029 RepID=UPI001A907F1F|nr:ribosome small subunit-dependent GTPase A [Corallococcus sp. NCRR]MBN9682175.1 ribosome small subunit-dependent GTPase A [Corallococcus sp. NCSPR001]WAS86263.1 ribosome small subunit-dependent GTPase A [Corallococcus sp. NCRR]